MNNALLHVRIGVQTTSHLFILKNEFQTLSYLIKNNGSSFSHHIYVTHIYFTSKKII